jgi:hypothetical protein
MIGLGFLNAISKRIRLTNIQYHLDTMEWKIGFLGVLRIQITTLFLASHDHTNVCAVDSVNGEGNQCKR